MLKVYILNYYYYLVYIVKFRKLLHSHVSLLKTFSYYTSLSHCFLEKMGRGKPSGPLDDPLDQLNGFLTISLFLILALKSLIDERGKAFVLIFEGKPVPTMQWSACARGAGTYRLVWF